MSIAYNAALQTATAALAAAGYRATRDSHHYRVIQSLAFTIGADRESKLRESQASVLMVSEHCGGKSVNDHVSSVIKRNKSLPLYQGELKRLKQNKTSYIKL